MYNSYASFNSSRKPLWNQKEFLWIDLAVLFFFVIWWAHLIDVLFVKVDFIFLCKLIFQLLSSQKQKKKMIDFQAIKQSVAGSSVFWNKIKKIMPLTQGSFDQNNFVSHPVIERNNELDHKRLKRQKNASATTQRRSQRDLFIFLSFFFRKIQSNIIKCSSKKETFTENEK